MALTCFDTLVGLSATDFACFTDTIPDDYDTSDSGYYLTDTDYGLTIAEQCTVDGWTLLDAALTQAIRETKTDLRAALRTRFDGYVTPFSGLIGQQKSNAPQTVNQDYIGLRIRTRRQKGVKLVIKKIYLALNTAGTYSVTITSNDPLFTSPAATSVTIATPNAFTGSAAVALELPFWSDSCPDDYLEYYISIDRNGATPRNNTLKCCGNNPVWLKHMDVTGFYADTDTPTDGAGGYSNQAYGFSLDAYLTCEELDWICELDELNGYHLKDVVARTIQFRGAAIAISSLIDRIQVNPCTGYQFENLNSRRAYLNKRYSENIQWIAQNMPNGVTDCFTCKPKDTFKRSRQLV